MALVFLGVPRFIIFGLFGGESLFGQPIFDPTATAIADYFNTLKTGNIWSVFATNATEGMINKADFQLGVFSRAYLTFAFFLGGMMLGRIRFFKDTSLYIQHLKRALKWSFITIAGVIAFALILFFVTDLSRVDGLNSWVTMIGLTLYDLVNLSLTIIIFSLFVILYEKARIARFFEWFIPYGRTALTNYFFQSVIGTALLYGWGLGLLGEIRNIEAFAIAFGVVVLQIVVSILWMRWFRYGPLEWIWRVATYMKPFSILKDDKSKRYN
jgi:uncharacterized protein